VSKPYILGDYKFKTTTEALETLGEWWAEMNTIMEQIQKLANHDYSLMLHSFDGINCEWSLKKDCRDEYSFQLNQRGRGGFASGAVGKTPDEAIGKIVEMYFKRTTHD